MIDWLHTMCHPDGEIALFNDAAMGIAPAPAEIFAYAERLGLTGTGRRALWLESSGYVRLEKGGTVVLADLARVGPDYLPGHAHADSLSFEMSLHGQRVFVNSGISMYGIGPERLRQRGTSAHNTVLVAGQNSSEVWGGFRVARRARVFDVQVIETVVARAAGRKIGLCGQAPSNDPEFARLLVAAGIHSISVTPDSFLAVKQHVAAAEKGG